MPTDNSDEIVRSLTFKQMEAGGRAAKEAVEDKTLMSKQNWAGEVAARIYAAIVLAKD